MLSQLNRLKASNEKIAVCSPANLYFHCRRRLTSLSGSLRNALRWNETPGALYGRSTLMRSPLASLPNVASIGRPDRKRKLLVTSNCHGR